MQHLGPRCVHERIVDIADWISTAQSNGSPVTYRLALNNVLWVNVAAKGILLEVDKKLRMDSL